MKVDIILTIEKDNGEVVDFTEDEAMRLYVKLEAIFGKKTEYPYITPPFLSPPPYYYYSGVHDGTA